MSSTASCCDHIDHVKTQIPYALFIAVLSLAAGIIPASFGVPYFFSAVFIFLLGVGALVFLKKKPAHK
jgi:Na+/H+ antiporter NhaC